jgi:fructokinase
MRQRWQRTLPAILPPPDEAARLVQPVVPGARLLACTGLAGGLANSNVRVDIPGHAPLVLRFYQRDPSAGPREAAIASLIPVCPRVLHVGLDDRYGPYAVTGWVDGHPLDRLPLGRQADLAGSLGRTLAGIHAHRFATAGFFGPDLAIATRLAGGGEGLIDYLRHCLVDGRGGARLGAELTAALLACADRHAGSLDRSDGPPSLTHGDFNGSNILVDNRGGLTVLDWEFAFAGSPFFDFGAILRPPLGDLPGVATAIASGYHQAGGRLPEDWQALSRLVDLLSWADFLNRPVADAALVADARAMIVRALRSFPA